MKVTFSEAQSRNPDVLGNFEGLLMLATPELYRQNSFRILGLPVNCTQQDVDRRRARLEMCLRLGLPAPESPSGAVMPVEPPPDEYQIIAASRRLCDPRGRLLDEFFWFWPQDSTSSDDQALDLMAQGRFSEAVSVWRLGENESRNCGVPTHNLAVYCHIVALQASTNEALSATTGKEEGNTNAWLVALRNWLAVLGNESLWQRVSLRVEELDDPRLKPSITQEIRSALPLLLSRINAQLAERAIEASKEAEARRQLRILNEAGFSVLTIQEALQSTIAHLRSKIHFCCSTAESKAQSVPENADRAALSLLEETSRMLREIGFLLPDGSPNRAEAFDEVASSALKCEIIYGNKSEDWVKSRSLLNQILQIAGSPETIKRVEANLRIVEVNIGYTESFGKLKNINGAPFLGGFLGIGFHLYGISKIHAETKSYMTTYYFTVFGIPIFPLRRYRVVRSANRYSFLGREPLRTGDKWHLGISIALITILVVWIAVSSSVQQTEPSVSTSPPAESTAPVATGQSQTLPSASSPSTSESPLLKAINAGKAKAAEMETELNGLEGQLQALSNQMKPLKVVLDDYKSRVEAGETVDHSDYQSQMDSYNSLVDQHNAILSRYKARHAEYSQQINQINQMVDQYNSGQR
jgi:hypothetical protein